MEVPFEKLNITASNDISENVLISLNEEGHEIDTFGIGTNLVTCQAQPALGGVYKLVSIDSKPRIKLSQEISKVTIPGRKVAYRLYSESGSPVVDLLQFADEPAPKEGDSILCCHPFDASKHKQVKVVRAELLLELVWDGKLVNRAVGDLQSIRSHSMRQLEAVPAEHLQIKNPKPYKVSVSDALYKYLHALWEAERPSST